MTDSLHCNFFYNADQVSSLFIISVCYQFNIDIYFKSLKVVHNIKGRVTIYMFVLQNKYIIPTFGTVSQIIVQIKLHIRSRRASF